ncbi:high affinity immunoglobulin gamma Fc receptor I-like [Anomaloglossus baeobatrachus]|uniref:high affinity immunoglobulin gamma Fc receptor I-like n=1 Tax=Anomaloglossus baeobatrachus TaxID=238106 RepID=UPI003F4FA1BA
MAEVIFIISMFTGLTEAVVRPVVTFTPIWTKILPGESVTMTCEVDGAVQGNTTYTWHKNNDWIHEGKTFTIQSAQSRHAGNYQCGTSKDNISEAVMLYIVMGPVILQTPPFIYEGDDLTLRCHTGSKDSQGPTVFYMDNEKIPSFANDSEILLRGHRTMSVVYKCARQVLVATENSIHSDKIDISPEAAIVPVIVTFSPNWKKIFTGESITMTCQGTHHGQYSWYKDGKLIMVTDQKSKKIHAAQKNDSGRYRCSIGSSFSPEVRLDVSVGPVILQAPLYVYHQHTTYLQCHSRTELSIQWTKFYKDGNCLQDSVDGKLFLNQPFVPASYKCEKKIHGYYVSYMDSASVPIRELFSSPNINVTQPVITEGGGMTLTCATRLSPRRPNIKLQFAFYRDGPDVQGFGPSDQYDVLAVRLEESGNYSCAAKTLDGRVWKKSQVLNVQIIARERPGLNKYLYPSVIVVLLIISAILVFRHRRQISKLFPKRLQTRDPQPVHSSEIKCTGEYKNNSSNEARRIQNDVTGDDDICYATLNLSLKGSPPKVTETSSQVLYSAVKMKHGNS